MKRRTGYLIAAVIAAASVWMGVARHRHARSAPQPVFLIIVDTLRFDRLSCYGYEAHQTPHMDELAKRGVRFTNAFSAASWTNPGVGSILTSLYPTQIGIVEQAVPGKRFKWREARKQRSYMIPLYETTLAEMLGSSGYRTCAFVDQPGLCVGEGFSQGFEEWYQPLDTVRVGRKAPAKRSPKPKKWFPLLSSSYALDNALVDEFEEWLPRHAGEKVFVWIHLLTPHRPYNPPAPFAPAQAESLDGLEAASARYDGEVRAVDAIVGRITAAIEKSVGMDRSLVVLTSDHGEAFGEHDMFEHGHTLHGEVTRVPLVICGPSLPRGRSIDDNVRTLDILPTILEAAGCAGVEPDAVMGKSLLPVIEGEGKPRMVYSEAMLYGSTERSLIVGDRKLMFDKQGKRFELYDLAADPDELVDIGGREKDRVRTMSARLRQFHRRLSEDYDARRKGRTIGDRARGKEKEEEMMRALRSLGYINE